MIERLAFEKIVRRALDEDIGTGDITTQATVARDRRSRAQIVAKDSGVVAGLPVVAEVYRQVDPDMDVRPQVADGDRVGPGDVLCALAGRAQSILTGERVALNFLRSE